ncbi:hypothetical protein ACFV2X_38145 [Streptomyces sp. NPDC059679]|uniref:hypothetical protein n=1 Tax=Streptomyces sp. NPDC059679 TaxID=3346903 RepID=UPI0036B39A36
MQASPFHRPVETVRQVPAAPAPEWENLFVQPVYAHGEIYDDGNAEGERDAVESPDVTAA